jgi:glycyl-tRNA synthetase beta chain
MRWGGTSNFVWVRPLKRILCLFDGQVVPFSLAQGEDDGHGLASSDQTEGHRLMSPGVFAVRDFADYAAQLAARSVVLDPAERTKLVRDGIAALAAAEGVEIVPDQGLLAEVGGLVEWPVPLLGRIDDAFMDLPAELMRTTMRVNQRYFALRKPDGSAAPFFALAANIAATDGGTAIIAGNERVLRARLSDARFFWDQDRKQPLESFLPKLSVRRVPRQAGHPGPAGGAAHAKLARFLAPKLGADVALATRAAKLAKADLATGLVGEFPELQGIIGRYYALHHGEAPQVAEAIAAHYRPAGPGDSVPATRSPSPWRWPTRSTSWPASSPPMSARPVRVTPMRCAARPSASSASSVRMGFGWIWPKYSQRPSSASRRPWAAPPSRNSAWPSPARS